MRAFEPLQSAGKAATGQPRPTLRIRDVVAITVGIIIGAGIFRTPSLVAGAAGSADMLLLAWAAGGVLSIIGALCYAELAAIEASAGGDYHYLMRAFGQRSEEHTSELQSLMRISYAVFCLKKKKQSQHKIGIAQDRN